MPGSSPGMTIRGRDGAGSGGAQRHPQGDPPPPSVSLPLLCGEFPRPGECRLRRARHERGPRLHAVDVRRRGRHFLRRLYPVRDPEQSRAAEIWRAHLDRPHHDQLGARRHRHGSRRAARPASTRCVFCWASPKRASSPASSSISPIGFRRGRGRASSRCSWRRCRWRRWSAPRCRARCSSCTGWAGSRAGSGCSSSKACRRCCSA